MKKCTRCGIEKPLNKFQVRKASKDGLTASCKACLSEYDKSRANKPERVRARLEYAKTDAGITAANRAKIAWTKRNKKKRDAALLVCNAVRDKKIIKPKFCSDCGVSGVRIHGHHDDYDKPLEVRWLCSQCHRDWHKENGEAKNAR